MSKLDLQELTYFILPGENSPDDLRQHYNSAYTMWKSVWSEAFVEIGRDPILSSDAFTKQHRIGALFKGLECVALTFFRPVHFSDITVREDSYFQIWPPEAIEKLIADGPKVLQCTNLTVSQKYRGEVAPGLWLKVLIIQLAGRYLLSTDCSVMTGAMRVERGAHKAAYAAGATKIASGIKGYDVMDIDLVGVFAKGLREKMQSIEMSWVDPLWNRRQGLLTYDETYNKNRAA